LATTNTNILQLKSQHGVEGNVLIRDSERSRGTSEDTEEHEFGRWCNHGGRDYHKLYFSKISRVISGDAQSAGLVCDRNMMPKNSKKKWLNSWNTIGDKCFLSGGWLIQLGEYNGGVHPAVTLEIWKLERWNELSEREITQRITRGTLIILRGTFDLAVKKKRIIELSVLTIRRYITAKTTLRRPQLMHLKTRKGYIWCEIWKWSNVVRTNKS